MRWRTKQRNDTRIKRKFLIIPRSFNGQTRWIEWANIEEIYMECVDFADGTWYMAWVENRFID
jgi:hypothetical protein